MSLAILTVVDPQWVLPLLAKLTLLLALGAALDLCLRAGNPRWRQGLWRGVMVGALLAVPISLAPPIFEITVGAPHSPPPSGNVSSMSGVRSLPMVDLPSPPPIMAKASEAPAVVSPSSQPAVTAIPLQSPGAATALSTLGLGTILFGLWGLGSLVFVGALLRDQRRVRAVVAGAEPVAAPVQALVTRLCGRLALGGAPVIVVSTAASSPFVTGVLRPTIVLPKGLKERSEVGDLAPVLAHELAHVQSRDLVWIALGNLLTVLLWFHPLMWLLRRFHDDACEHVSDRVAADLIGDPGRYSRTLARMAIARSFTPSTSIAIPMARRARVLGRLALLERGLSAAHLPAFGRRLGGLVLLLGVATLTTVELVSAEPFTVPTASPGQPVVQSVDRPVPQDGEDEKAAERRRYTELILANPMDPMVPDYLTRTKASGYASEGYVGRSHPLSEQIKALYRERLAKEPDGEAAWLLTQIIGVQLSNTSIGLSNGDRSYGKWAREAPLESFATLEEALRVAFDRAEPASERWHEAGTMLAKLHMLRGDWEGVDRQLALLGQEPLDPALREHLHAPPFDWSALAATWKMSDPELRTGTCGLDFSFVKDGRPLAGVHVLVRRVKPQSIAFYTGWAADTILSSGNPDGFGYRAESTVTQTRYGVSGADGAVRMRNLPEMDFEYEILVPTGNFAEPGRSWDLLVELPSGEMHRSPMNNDTRVLLSIDGMVKPKLEPGRDVRFPRIEVIPSFYTLNVSDWDPVPAESFVLTWPGDVLEQNSEQVAYDVTLTLSAPAEVPGWSSWLPILHSQTVRTTEPMWLMGKEGVGDLRLRPGNIYLIDVAAVDVKGEAQLASWRRAIVWVPWEHGPQVPPLLGDEVAPIHHNSWKNGQFAGHRDSDERPDETLDRFLEEKPEAFEHAYVRVGKAWQNWLRDGEAVARPLLEALVSELPTGNVARATARDLLARMGRGEEPPQRLFFVAGE